MNRHRTTDPACTRHYAPKTALGRWWYDRARGKSCGPCMGARRVASRKASKLEAAKIRNENGGWS